MEIIGLDLHKRESQLSLKADDGTITDRRIATRRERFTAVFGERPPARILLEASTESGIDGRVFRSAHGRGPNYSTFPLPPVHLQPPCRSMRVRGSVKISMRVGSSSSVASVS